MNGKRRGGSAGRAPDDAVIVKSPANDRVKLLRGLSAAPVRKRTGMTLVEGIVLVREALDSGASFVTAAYDEDAAGSARVAELVARLRSRAVDVWPAAHRVFKHMAQTETPQGILAAIRVPEYPVERAMREIIARARETRDALVVLMDGVQDPGNAGSIVRSADAFGASCVIFGGTSADPYNPKVLRASTGSVFHIPCVVACDAAGAAQSLLTEGFRLYYGDPRAETPVYSVSLSGMVIIVAGNEAAGVSPSVRALGSAIAVPIHGMAESLNVSMALTAMLYEARRQRSLAL